MLWEAGFWFGAQVYTWCKLGDSPNPGSATTISRCGISSVISFLKMRMNRMLTSKRAALDTITMQRRPNYCRHQKKMLLKIAKRSVHQQDRPLVAGWAISTAVVQQQLTMKELHSFSPCVSLHCKLYAPLVTARTGGTPFISTTLAANSHTIQRTFHTATSPSGTDSHTLLSTRWGKFTSQDDARRQVARLSAEERAHLEKAIEDLKERSEMTQSEPPTWNQLKLCKAMLVPIFMMMIALTYIFLVHSVLSKCPSLHWLWISRQCYHDFSGKSPYLKWAELDIPLMWCSHICALI